MTRFAGDGIPEMRRLGYDSVGFGVLVVVELGLITPPVGMNRRRPAGSRRRSIHPPPRLPASRKDS